MDMVDALANLLRVERLELNLFRGVSADIGRDHVFGGQILGQALMAAAATVDGRTAHSLHAYFLRPGDIHAPVLYDVERIRDGGSFSTRRVVAIQHGQPILHTAISFQVGEPGLEHQAKMPEVPPPEVVRQDPASLERILARLDNRMREALQYRSAFELREVHPDLPAGRDGLEQHCIWLRPCGQLPNDPLLQQAALAYVSNFNLLQTAMLRHQVCLGDDCMQVASLDHSMWFHQPVDFSDWLLYVTDSPRAGNARGFCRGSLFDRQGRLVASVAQEGLVRDRRLRSPAAIIKNP